MRQRAQVQEAQLRSGMPHADVIANPTAAWTLQQFWEVITGEQAQHFLIHDRDSIYSTDFDASLKAMALEDIGDGP